MNQEENQHKRTLFLDRDGVLNVRLPGQYVCHWNTFQFTPGALEALQSISHLFQHIVVVTNQQGIGKGLMNTQDLHSIHDRMLKEIAIAGGRIDKCYFCPDLKTLPNNCRKPSPSMAYQAQKDFPDISFEQSIMIGDSISDLQFGRNLGMHTIWITGKQEAHTRMEKEPALHHLYDEQFDSLSNWAAHYVNK